MYKERKYIFLENIKYILKVQKNMSSANTIFDNDISTSIDLSGQGQHNSHSTDPVVLSIDNFSNTMTAAKAVLPGVTLPSFDVSCEAVLFLKTSWIRSVFEFKADQDAEGEFTGDNMKFFTNFGTGENWDPNTNTTMILNPAHAQVYRAPADISFGQEAVNGDQHLPVGRIPLLNVSESDVSSNKFMIKHDYARHIATELFHIPATDYFYNLDEVLASIEIGGLAAWNNIKVILENANNSGQGLTEEDDLSGNIVFQLLQQMRVANPYRFKASGLPSTIDASGERQQPLPFVHGDVIVFTFTVNADSTQGEALKDGTNSTIPDATVSPRKYLIKLCVVDEVTGAHANEIPDDTYKINSADGNSVGDLNALGDIDNASLTAVSEQKPPASYENVTMKSSSM